MKNLDVCLIIVGISLVTGLPPAFSDSKTITTDSRAVIGPILELTISQQGQSELKFGNIQPSASGSTQVGPVVMVINVNANTGERYQVTQTMSGALENASGSKLDLTNLKFTTAASKSNGIVVSSPTQVSGSAQVIFTSDALGSSDTISTEYTLTVPPTQDPGDYSANLTYTVSSL